MAIYFSNTLSKEPFQFDSVGNHWLQEALSRPQGYPIYHYLQTEEGCGIFTIDGKEYFLPEDHGILDHTACPTCLPCSRHLCMDYVFCNI